MVRGRHVSSPGCAPSGTFACIALLWVIGVVRARLGDREDRFHAKRPSRRANPVQWLESFENDSEC
jgi:hypothetical protein